MIMKEVLVPMRLGETRVPIPNTKVKTQSADDTMLETAWESRWVPEHQEISSVGEHLFDIDWCLPVIERF